MNPERDVIIAGGGAMAASIARECARRGFAVTLLEPDGLCADERMPALFPAQPWIAPSSAEGQLARLSALRALGTHRVTDRRALAILRGKSLRTAAIAARLEARLAWASRTVDQEHQRISAAALRSLEPGICPNAAGAIAVPCHSVNAATLAVAIARDAATRGAQVRWGVDADGADLEATGLEKGARWVRTRDRVSGDSETMSARLVVDATPDARLAQAAGFDVRRLGYTWVALEGALCDHVIGDATSGRGEGRLVIVPDGLCTWVRLEDGHASADDPAARLDRLRARAASLLPAIKHARAVAVLHGSVAQGRFDPAEVHQASERLVLALAPSPIDWLGLALSAVVEIARILGEDPTRATAIDALPAGPMALRDAPFVGASMGIGEVSALAMGRRRGADIEPVARLIGDVRHRRATLCPCAGVLEAEADQAVHEGARDLDALARRTGVGVGACGGVRCIHRAAQLISSMSGGTGRDAIAMQARFMRARIEEAEPSGAALVLEELTQARIGAGAETYGSSELEP